MKPDSPSIAQQPQLVRITCEIVPLLKTHGLPTPYSLRGLPGLDRYQAIVGGKLFGDTGTTLADAMENVRLDLRHVMCTTFAVPKDEHDIRGYVFWYHPQDVGKMCILPLQQMHTFTAKKIVVTAMLSMIRYGFPRDLVKMIGQLIFQIPNLADHAVKLVCFRMSTNAVDVQKLVGLANHCLSL